MKNNKISNNTLLVFSFGSKYFLFLRDECYTISLETKNRLKCTEPISLI